jgi:hypothetical protein
MKKQILTGLLAATLCTNAFAGEVTGYTPATSGEVATAEAINTRFDALIAAINDNNARVAELESFDVSGKTFDFKEVGTIVAAETYGNISTPPGGPNERQNGFARIGLFTSSAQMTFVSDGTVSISGVEREVETFLNPNSDIGIIDNIQYSLTATWAQVGNEVTVIVPDGFTYEFAVSRGATMFTGIINNDISLQDTSNDDRGTYRLYNVESSIQVGTLIE